MHDTNDRPAVMVRTMECVTAAFIFALGLVAIYDSIRIGFGWSEDGPQAGYFPFYIGCFICISSAIIFVMALLDKTAASETFVTRNSFVMVLKVLIPTILYVIGIQFLGIYVASTIFIGLFMWWIGKYSLMMILPVSLGVSVAFFMLFERWFAIPLPKGPLEAWLGLL